MSTANSTSRDRHPAGADMLYILLLVYTWYSMLYSAGFVVSMIYSKRDVLQHFTGTCSLQNMKETILKNRVCLLPSLDLDAPAIIYCISSSGTPIVTIAWPYPGYPVTGTLRSPPPIGKPIDHRVKTVSRSILEGRDQYQFRRCRYTP
jgi:hypothetical protein